MNYSKQYINELAEKTGFIANNVEKVIRLLDVLNYIFEKSTFKDALSLKGGTAINLIYTNLKRLSVDIDLDYYRHLDKDKAAADRDVILEELDKYMTSQGYAISNKSRGSKILSSRMYQYLSAAGNNDNIKVEINFIDRISLYDKQSFKIEYFDKAEIITSLRKEEVYGMKIAALIDRSKPRDLYDVKSFFDNFNDIDINALRKATIFYLSLDGIFTIDDNLFARIKSINQSEIKKELLPVLKKGETFFLDKAKDEVIARLRELLNLNENERLYLERFSNGNYDASLLFDNECSKTASKHPMARWRADSLKQKN